MAYPVVAVASSMHEMSVIQGCLLYKFSPVIVLLNAGFPFFFTFSCSSMETLICHLLVSVITNLPQLLLLVAVIFRTTYKCCS